MIAEVFFEITAINYLFITVIEVRSTLDFLPFFRKIELCE